MEAWNELVWAQFDAAIQTLDDAIAACSDATWRKPCGRGAFWHTAYHTIYFLDLYADESVQAHVPPEPFTPSELEDDAMPPREFTKEELAGYSRYARRRVLAQIEALGPAELAAPSGFDWLSRRGLTVAETVVYNMRHVQHHAAQLNLILRQEQDFGVPWIFRASRES